jgi:CheY-like chemotaxis protein
MMPVMNGWELRAALQREPDWQDIPVVVISAVQPDVAGRLPDTMYVPKPVDIDALLDMVCTYCRERDGRATGA